MSFDRLDQVRSLARARAVEDFEFFANHVLGAKLDAGECRRVQDCVERGLLVEGIFTRVQVALNAWLVVIGRVSSPCEFKKTETLEWLFPQELGKVAA